MSGFLLLVIALPALGAAALAGGGAGRDRAARLFAGAIGIAVLLAALPLWAGFESRGDEWQATTRVPLIPDIGAAFSVGLDGLSLTLVMLTVIAAAVLTWPLFGAVGEPDSRHALVPGLLLLTGLIGAFTALDLLLLAFCWPLAVGAAIVLSRRAGAADAAVKLMAALAAAGAVALLAVAFALHSHYAALANVESFDLRPLQRVALPASLQWSAFAGCAIAIAAAVVVAAMVAAQPGLRGAPAVAALGLYNLAAFVLLRIVLPILPDAARAAGPIAVRLMLVASLATTIAALVRSEWRRSIALASLAYALLSLAAAWTRSPDSLTASVLYLVALGLAMPVLAVFGAYPAPADLPSARPAAVAKTRFAAALFVLALLTLAGFPGAAGFVGLRLFAEGAWEASRMTALAGAAATVLAAASLTLFFLRTISSNAVVSASHLRRRHLLPLAALVGLAVWVGLHPQPVLSRLETSVARIVMRVSPEFAADVADCLKPRAPSAAAASSGLPAGMSMAEPCEDGSAPPAPAGR